MGELTKIEVNMAKLTTNIEHIKGSLVDNVKQHKEIMDKMDDWIVSADKKYSPIWVSRVIIWGSSIVGASMIISLLALIGKVYLELY